VSGGCLEDDLLKKAWWLTDQGPVFRRYDTTPEGEIGQGFGLGCNGIIDLLLERVRPEQRGVIEWITEVQASRRPAVLCHLLGAGCAGARVLIEHDGRVAYQNLVEPSQLETIRELAVEALASGASRHAAIEGADLFLETLLPPVRLLIFGAGDDAVPLTRLAAYLGWRTRVFDGRAHYARPEKFPDVEDVAVHPAGAELPIDIDPWTAAVLMTHSYSQDLAALRQLAIKMPRYIGILGPRKRSDMLLADAGLERGDFAGGLYGPTGLDVGADGAHQVALAIVAEVQAVLNRRQGGHLRDVRASIHATEADQNGQWRGSIVCA
jgi:xanthine/CO dehydrogenase XdhC/CoxF family maturation factor